MSEQTREQTPQQAREHTPELGTVVVTGATGNVGTSVLDALVADPAVRHVVGIARRPPQRVSEKVEWVAADVSKDDLEPYLAGADAVVHLAWLFQPTHSPTITWDANVVGSVRVFEATVRAGVPTLVYASSVGAYSPGPDDAAVDESWPTHGWAEAAYTREKAYVERALDAVEARHPQMRVVRMRPAFIFKRSAASQQRRLFAGPFLPGRLVRPATVPIVPDLPGFRFQALHTEDAAEAYRLALHHPVHGAFNIAADPVVDAALLAELLDARVVRVPATVAKAAVAALWRMHLVPATPGLLDAVLHLPVMDTSRARTELGWQPAHTSRDALGEFLVGLRQGAGGDTAPLAARAEGGGRLQEVRTGVGTKP